MEERSEMQTSRKKKNLVQMISLIANAALAATVIVIILVYGSKSSGVKADAENRLTALKRICSLRDAFEDGTPLSEIQEISYPYQYLRETIKSGMTREELDTLMTKKGVLPGSVEEKDHKIRYKFIFFEDEHVVTIIVPMTDDGKSVSGKIEWEDR